MARPVKAIKHVVTRDVDVSGMVDVKTIDAHVYSCLSAAQDAIERKSLPGFPDAESAHVWSLVGCMSHSHRSIRKLLLGEQNPSAVDALAVARLQVESLYTLCYLLQSPENVRLFLKNGWKKKYVRFLLHREEHVNLRRFDEFYSKVGIGLIDKLQGVSFVSDAERRKIECDQLGYPLGPKPLLADIPPFPTPGRVIRLIRDPNQRRMLERIYPEYEFLCSFAHGDSESVFSRSIADPRSRFRNLFSSSEMEDFYQKGVLEPPVMYSVLSAVQVATEIAAVYPADIELCAKVTGAWNLLTRGSLIAVPAWELRAKGVLGAIGP
ncbi:MAG: hypothetical protein ACLP07_18010 [Terracidiphilus sp.]